VQEIIGQKALDVVESLIGVTETVQILVIIDDLADDFGLESFVITDFEDLGPRLGQEVVPDDVPLICPSRDTDLKYFNRVRNVDECRVNTWRLTWRKAPVGANGQGEHALLTR
jgi:hypothetical protein